MSNSKVMLGATNRSMAAICIERLRRKVSHPCEGEAGRLIMYFATLDEQLRNRALAIRRG
jgi:hypothetical protein